MPRIALALLAAVAVVVAAGVALFLASRVIDARGFPQGRSLWTGRLDCTSVNVDAPDAPALPLFASDVVLSVLRSGNALQATFMFTPRNDGPGALGAVRESGAVDVTGAFGFVAERWLARPPGMNAPSLRGRPSLTGAAIDVDVALVGGGRCAPLLLTRAEDSGEVIALGESRWVGRYTCLQGETALDLAVTHDAPDELAAVFSFSPGPQTPAIPSGSFHLAGAVDRVHNRVLLAPGDWMEHPPRWVTVGLRGTVDLSADIDVIRGDVRASNIGIATSAPDGCSTFEVRLR